MIVKEYLMEDRNQIKHLKFKTEKMFELIHYIYYLLFSKIYNKTNTFGIQRKITFNFILISGKQKRIKKFTN